MALFKRKEELTLRIEGMTCEHCEMRVQKAAESVAGVEKARADRNEGVVVIQTKRKAEVSREAIVAAINEIGYKTEV